MFPEEYYYSLFFPLPPFILLSLPLSLHPFPSGAVLRVLEKPLRFLGKMNLIKPDEEAEPAGDPPHAEPPTEPHSEDAYSNLGGSYLPPGGLGGTESPADGADNCTSSEAGDLQRFAIVLRVTFHCIDNCKN